MPTAYLENTWYLIAWSDEIGTDTLLGRTLLDQPIVMFRTSDGVAAAIADMCPHRFAPLSMGKKVGDAVQCAYHGLQFDRTGSCVRNPHGVNGHIPRAAHVRSYPVVERYEGAWVWMGDGARADSSLIPNLEEELVAAEGRFVHRQYVHVGANYELMSDNIMDLSHIEYLHAGSLGTPAVGKGEIVVERDGDTVWCKRRIPDDVLTPALAMFLELPERLWIAISMRSGSLPASTKWTSTSPHRDHRRKPDCECQVSISSPRRRPRALTTSLPAATPNRTSRQSCLRTTKIR